MDDPARYISAQGTGGANTGADVVGSAFGTLFPLGTGMYTETATGDVDTIAFSLDAAGEAFAVSQINSGGLLRIIATPADVAVQATYSGAGSILDPFSPPVLNVVAGTGVLKGDVDMDGDVDFADIPPFIAVLQAGTFQAEADADCSSFIDFDDIPAFIEILIAQ